MPDTCGGSLSLYTEGTHVDGILVKIKRQKEIEPSVREKKVFAQMPDTSNKGGRESQL